MAQVPTYEDIYEGSSNVLDGATAAEHYLGLTLEEAARRIGDGTMVYLEDLSHMGPRAFRYYFAALVAYLRSDAAEGDPMAWRWLQLLVRDRMADLDGETRALALEALRYILVHERKFTEGTDEYVHDPRDLIAKLEASASP